MNIIILRLQLKQGFRELISKERMIQFLPGTTEVERIPELTLSTLINTVHTSKN